MALAQLLDEDSVAVPLQNKSKDRVLGELVSLAHRSSGFNFDAEAALQAVLSREELISTGVGNGIAIPHALVSGLDRPVMAAGVARPPLDFLAQDGNPVDLLFLTLFPAHLAGSSGQTVLRAELSSLLLNRVLCQRLCSCRDAADFIQLVIGFEKQ